MIPSVGKIVHYTLTAQNAENVNKRRWDAELNKETIVDTSLGYIVHVGNSAAEGYKYPMLIVAVHGDTETSLVSGQVFLDGNDTLWVTSRGQGDGNGQWHEPTRIG